MSGYYRVTAQVERSFGVHAETADAARDLVRAQLSDMRALPLFNAQEIAWPDLSIQIEGESDD